MGQVLFSGADRFSSGLAFRGTFGFLHLTVGFHFDPSFRFTPAFVALSSFGKIVRIVELSPLNAQPTTAVINIGSWVSIMQGAFFSHWQIVNHFMKIRQFVPPVKVCSIFSV
jgi:hypothetical protein